MSNYVKEKDQWLSDSKAYSKPAGTAQDLFAGFIVIATITFFATLLINHWNNESDISHYNKNVYSTEFFSAVQNDDPSHITEAPLREFYDDLILFTDLVEQEEIVENELIPGSLSELYIDGDRYGGLCKYFHHLASEASDRDQEGYNCNDQGLISLQFENEFNAAKLDQSFWMNKEFIRPQTDKLKIWFFDYWTLLGLYSAIYVLLSIVVISPYTKYHTNRWGKYSYIYWYPEGRKHFGFYFTSLVNPVFYLKMKKWMKPEKKRNKQKQELLNKAKFAFEINKIQAKIDQLKSFVPTTDKIKKNIKDLEEIKKDLASFDTVMSIKTMEYLSAEAVKEAREAKIAADGHLAARDEVERI